MTLTTAKTQATAPADWSIANLLADPRLHEVVRATLGNAERFVTPRGARIVRSNRYDQPVFFTINNKDDRIHKRQLKGFFYEHDQLALMADYMTPGGTFCDVGANVGNHSLYMLLFGGAARAIPFEPNPGAIALLSSNVLLNGLGPRVEFATLGYGLDETSEDGLAIHAPAGNLGWARVKRTDGAAGDISVRTGDALLAGEDIDFLKMDVEGMEIGALKGLRQTITRCRPVLFVEVDNSNQEAFAALMEEFGYRIEQALAQGGVNQNMLLVPAERGRT